MAGIWRDDRQAASNIIHRARKIGARRDRFRLSIILISLHLGGLYQSVQEKWGCRMEALRDHIGLGTGKDNKVEGGFPRKFVTAYAVST